METVSDSIAVEASAHAAYTKWREWDQSRRILQRLRQVRRLDDQRFHWQDETMDATVDWDDAVIIEDVPDQHLAWQGRSGPDNTVAADFERLSSARSRVTVVVNYQPVSSLRPVTQTGAEDVTDAVRAVLADFKAKVEQDPTPERNR